MFSSLQHRPSFNERVTDSRTSPIADGCSQRRDITQTSCENITEDSATGHRCDQLENINICNRSSITDVSIAAVGKWCPNRQRMDALNLENSS
jgi:hypothetical protein